MKITECSSSLQLSWLPKCKWSKRLVALKLISLEDISEYYIDKNIDNRIITKCYIDVTNTFLATVLYIYIYIVECTFSYKLNFTLELNNT